MADTSGHLDLDRTVLRDYISRRVREHAAWRAEHRDEIICNAAILEDYFWEGQTEQERADTKQFLVDNALASWVIPR